MNALFPFLWTLGWAFVSQVLLFQHGMFWGGYGLLAVHLYGLLKMPGMAAQHVSDGHGRDRRYITCLTEGCIWGICDVGYGLPL